MAEDRGSLTQDKQKALQIILRGIGLEADEVVLARLAPQAPALSQLSDGMAELDLSGIEPALAFDALWEE